MSENKNLDDKSPQFEVVNDELLCYERLGESGGSSSSHSSRKPSPQQFMDEPTQSQAVLLAEETSQNDELLCYERLCESGGSSSSRSSRKPSPQQFMDEPTQSQAVLLAEEMSQNDELPCYEQLCDSGGSSSSRSSRKPSPQQFMDEPTQSQAVLLAEETSQSQPFPLSKELSQSPSVALLDESSQSRAAAFSEESTQSGLTLDSGESSQSLSLMITPSCSSQSQSTLSLAEELSQSQPSLFIDETSQTPSEGNLSRTHNPEPLQSTSFFMIEKWQTKQAELSGRIPPILGKSSSTSSVNKIQSAQTEAVLEKPEVSAPTRATKKAPSSKLRKFKLNVQRTVDFPSLPSTVSKFLSGKSTSGVSEEWCPLLDPSSTLPAEKKPSGVRRKSSISLVELVKEGRKRWENSVIYDLLMCTNPDGSKLAKRWDESPGENQEDSSVSSISTTTSDLPELGLTSEESRSSSHTSKCKDDKKTKDVTMTDNTRMLMDEVDDDDSDGN